MSLGWLHEGHDTAGTNAHTAEGSSKDFEKKRKDYINAVTK